MNKNIIIGIFLLSAIILLSNFSLAEMTEIKDTAIDYVSYREIVVDEPGVIYKIKITNTGTRERTYEIIPDSEIIRNIGTYRLDPSDKISLKPGKQETVYLYLAVEKEVEARTTLPVRIKSGLSETTIDLVARPVGPFQPEQKSNLLTSVFKIILVIVLVIIIIVALIFAFTRIKRKKEDEEEEDLEPDFDEDVETYY